MQQNNVNWPPLPNKNSQVEEKKFPQIIKIEDTQAYRRSKNREQISGDPVPTNNILTLAKTPDRPGRAIDLHCVTAIDEWSDRGVESNYFSTGNLHLIDLRWHQEFKLEQEPSATHYIIYLVLTGFLEQEIDRDRTLFCSPESATIVNPDRELVMIGSEDGEALSIAIERSALDRTLSTMLDRPLKQPLTFCPSIDLTAEWGSSIKHLARFIWESAPTGKNTLAFPLWSELEKTFLAGLLEGLSHNYSEELLYQQNGAFAYHVHRATTFIEDHLEENITVSDIAAAVGVCPRVLQKAFADRCGCSPIRWLTQTRLYRIRQELEAANTDTKIVEVMMRYGFTQGGKFAKEYQQLFGEKPSTTVRRSIQSQG
jgi:AraC-like DNA-binding protein